MNFSQFSKYFKSAIMLDAREGMAMIERTNFHAYKKEDRAKIMRRLKQTSDQFLTRDVKDYREVFKNLALNLMRGGRK